MADNGDTAVDSLNRIHGFQRMRQEEADTEFAVVVAVGARVTIIGGILEVYGLFDSCLPYCQFLSFTCLVFCFNLPRAWLARPLYSRPAGRERGAS